MSARKTINLHRSSALGAMCALLAVLAVAAPAFATGPVWQVSSEGLPTALPPGGRGQYQIEIANVGEIASTGMVTVVDTLPSGVTATAAGELLVGQTGGIGESYWHCAGAMVVVCHSEAEITPSPLSGQFATNGLAALLSPSLVGLLAPTLAIEVNVSPTAAGVETNTVEASGGGAVASAVDSAPQTIAASTPNVGFSRFGVEVLNRDGSPDTQVGSHPYAMTTSFTLNNNLIPKGAFFPDVESSQEMRDVQVDLPVGLVGDPQATPKCPRAVFDIREIEPNNPSPPCPADTQVGTVVFRPGGRFPRETTLFPLYNLVPPPGMPAQFGFAFQSKLGFIDAGVRTGAGYGLKVELRNIVETKLLETTVTLWGVPGDPNHNAERGVRVVTGAPYGEAAIKPLLTLPSQCGASLTTSIFADFWQEPGPFTAEGDPETSSPLWKSATSTAPASTEGCEKLAFSPTLTLRPETSASSTPTGVEADLRVPQTPDIPEGLATSDLKNATAILPEGMVLSPSQANGLQACAPEQVGLNNAAEASCPEASKVGAVEVTSPLLEGPLEGSVYLAQQGNAGPAQGSNPFNSLVAIYVVVEEPKAGVLIKLPGKVSLNPVTGQLTTAFSENPQLPFSDFKLTFFGGGRAPLVTPQACGFYPVDSVLEGWSGATAPASVPTNGFSINAGCTQGFAPAFVAGTTVNQAAGFSPLTVSVARNDGEQELSGVTVNTPPGLLGMLSNVTLCSEPQAQQNACPASSQIGHVTIAAGPGPTPAVLPQAGRAEDPVYLTGPYNGAPFGLLILTHAEAGPFNLGPVPVRASIRVDPHTGQLTVVSDPLPRILQGIPLQLRHVNVIVDRPSFTFNPTDCEPLAVNGTIASTRGAQAQVSSHFQAVNCALLGFTPKFTASTQAKTSKADGASLHVNVGYPSGGMQASIASAKVTLPKQLPARLTTLQKACTEATFAANPAACPAASSVGTAKVVTPVLDEPLTGPAYLVSHGGAAFPDLDVVLQGQGVTLDLVGNTDIVKQITTSTFASVPDAPISSFALMLPAGPDSALAPNLSAKAKGSMCAINLVMPTTLVAHSGARLTQNTKVAVTGCPKVHHKARPKRRRKAQKGRK
jgi:uncharacterized repeat protein (TIGR01451 family)